MVSEHGREQWVAEKTVKLGGGAGVARRGLRAAMATAELQRSAAAAAGKKGRQKGNGSAGRLGRVLAVMKARPGAAWPARSGRWRRAAVAGDTRRAMSEAGRPLTSRFS